MNTSVTRWQQLTAQCCHVAGPCLPSLFVWELTKSVRKSYRLRSNNTTVQARTCLALHRNRIKDNVVIKESEGLWPLIFKASKTKVPAVLYNLNLSYYPCFHSSLYFGHNLNSAISLRHPLSFLPNLTVLMKHKTHWLVRPRLWWSDELKPLFFHLLFIAHNLLPQPQPLPPRLMLTEGKKRITAKLHVCNVKSQVWIVLCHYLSTLICDCLLFNSACMHCKIFLVCGRSKG